MSKLRYCTERKIERIDLLYTPKEFHEALIDRLKREAEKELASYAFEDLKKQGLVSVEEKESPDGNGIVIRISISLGDEISEELMKCLKSTNMENSRLKISLLNMERKKGVIEEMFTNIGRLASIPFKLIGF